MLRLLLLLLSLQAAGWLGLKPLCKHALPLQPGPCYLPSHRGRNGERYSPAGHEQRLAQCSHEGDGGVDCQEPLGGELVHMLPQAAKGDVEQPNSQPCQHTSVVSHGQLRTAG